MPDTQHPASAGIQVISRAADILRALREQPGGMSLGEIARVVALPRSTVQRIVSALNAEGFVSTEQGRGGIRLGPEIQGLAQASARDTRDRLRPIMARIAEETGETVDLAVLDGQRMLFIDQIVGSQRLRTVSSIGDRFPLTTTANGKAALASMPVDLAEAAVRAEIADPDRAAARLEEVEGIRTGHLASDIDEHTEGISAFGFAVMDRAGAIYAISVPVPSSRFDPMKDRLRQILTRYRDDLRGQAF